MFKKADLSGCCTAPFNLIKLNHAVSNKLYKIRFD